MTIDAMIMFAGGFVALLPFLGFPNSWDSALFFLAGVLVIALGIAVRRRGLREPRPRPGETSGEPHSDDVHAA